MVRAESPALLLAGTGLPLPPPGKTDRSLPGGCGNDSVAEEGRSRQTDAPEGTKRPPQRPSPERELVPCTGTTGIRRPVGRAWVSRLSHRDRRQATNPVERPARLLGRHPISPARGPWRATRRGLALTSLTILGTGAVPAVGVAVPFRTAVLSNSLGRKLEETHRRSDGHRRGPLVEGHPRDLTSRLGRHRMEMSRCRAVVATRLDQYHDQGQLVASQLVQLAAAKFVVEVPEVFEPVLRAGEQGSPVGKGDNCLRRRVRSQGLGPTAR